MTYKYDYIVVGSGFSGAVFAREAKDAGKKVLVVERRSHIGGNAYTEKRLNIDVHVYGCHIFHTKNERVWSWINRFTNFNNYRHTAKVRHKDVLYSFPINLMTLQQLWGVTTPDAARARLEASRIPCSDPQTLEEWSLAMVGRELYTTFIEGYTTKQWGMHPRNLPRSIIQRIPIRLDFNDSYFHSQDKHQGIPEEGYTAAFEKILGGIPVELNVDFLRERHIFEHLAPKIVYTGPVDELLDYEYGQLDYRSLRFEHEEQLGDFQGCSVVNYAEASVPWTRIIEHKHFMQRENERTIITREYPQTYDGTNVPYYPMADAANLARYDKYKAQAKRLGYLLVGRLATYKYLDMDSCIGAALVAADRELRR